MAEQLQIINRVLDILEYLSLAENAKGPTAIAEAVGLSKGTVHRILSSLCARGYVEKNEKSGTYYIGIKLVEVVSNHINNLELQTEARYFLNELQAELGLVVHLGILDRHEVIYVEKMDLVPNLRSYTQVGVRVPAQCSSLGKCMLACMSGDQLEYIMKNCNFEQYTPFSITNLRELKVQLRKVRSQGWAIDNEEYLKGHRCVGAPIYDYRGETIAALSASGSVHQLSDARLEHVIQRVKETSASISRKLCYSDSLS